MKERKALAVILSLTMLASVTVLVVAVAIPGASAGLLSIEKLSPKVLGVMLEGGQDVSILVRTSTQEYAPLVATIEAMGGSVGYQYEYAPGLSAQVPASALWELAASSAVVKVYLDEPRQLTSAAPTMEVLDEIVATPSPFSLDGVRTITLTEDQLSLVEPNTYYNYVATDANAVWSTGDFGRDSLAVIIDTGIFSDHFMLSPLYPEQILGGVDMSPDVGTENESFDAPWNHWHGSHVAGILAGHGAILVKSGHPLLQAIKRYSNMPLQDAAPFGFPGWKIVPLLGQAPLTQLYIIKVFPHTGAGVSESRIIAAIEHAIDLKVSEGVDVDVISMSLGGATLFDGRDLEDQTVDAATAAGITVVSAAGNDGPAPMTVASPGSANSGITVAAAAHPVNTRVFWDYALGQPGIGHSLFVSDTPQIYAFSSRGPTSDGRLKPDVAATGLLVLSAFPSVLSPQGLAFASGTSMATPGVSGVVSLLNTFAEGAIPAATPTDLKQAIQNGAIWLEGYGAWDQGGGYLNAWNALQELMDDPSLGDLPEPLAPEGELEDITNIPIVGAGTFEATIANLEPGMAETYVFAVTAATNSITLSMTGVDVGRRNPFGLNSFEVYIQSAKRTTYAYYIDSANVFGDATFIVTDDGTLWSGAVSGVFFDPFTRRAPIEPGFVKIILENDWTSKGPVSASVEISVTEGPMAPPDLEITGAVADGSLVFSVVAVPSDATTAVVELWWENDWTTYPTADLDLYVFNGTAFNFQGATLNAPERAFVVNLEDTSTLVLFVDGFTVWGATESFTLRVTFATE